MAPVVYYLNKSYIENSNANKRDQIDEPIKSATQATAGLGRAASARAFTCRRAGGSGETFRWHWTAPGAFLAACIALGMAGSFYNVYRKELPPSWFYTMADPDSKALYFSEHLTKLWAHLAVFAMGLIAGAECRRLRKRAQSGFRASNMGLMGRSGGLSAAGARLKSHSSSASSLPTTFDESLGANFETAASSKPLAAGDNSWTAGQRHHHYLPTGANGHSVSININHTAPDQRNQQQQQHHEDGLTTGSAGGSEIACLNSTSSLEGEARRSRGRACSLLADLLGFMMAITIMAAIIFSTHDWSLHDLPGPLTAGLFDAGSRFLWSLALIWILYKLSVPLDECPDRLSPLARALGHPALVCLGKLSFLIYIIHPFVHTTVLAIQEQPIYSSWLMMFHILIGNISITVIMASLVSLFVEMPCRNLFRRCGTSLLLTQSVQSYGGGGGPTGGPTGSA